MELDQERLAEMKRAELVPGAVGLWVLFTNPRDDYDVPGKGRIIGKEGDYFLVQHFCVVTGEADEGIHLWTGKDLARYKLYRTAEEMERDFEEVGKRTARNIAADGACSVCDRRGANWRSAIIREGQRLAALRDAAKTT